MHTILNVCIRINASADVGSTGKGALVQPSIDIDSDSRVSKFLNMHLLTEVRGERIESIELALFVEICGRNVCLTT